MVAGAVGFSLFLVSCVAVYRWFSAVDEVRMGKRRRAAHDVIVQGWTRDTQAAFEATYSSRVFRAMLHDRTPRRVRGRR